MSGLKMTKEDAENLEWRIIESYFKNQYLNRLVRHQIESYNDFVNIQMPKTIRMFNPVNIRSENDYIPEYDKYLLEANINFVNFKLYPPQIHENNGATKMLLPQEAKLRNFTYSSPLYVDMKIEFINKKGEKFNIIEKKETYKNNSGWFGITDKYWLSAIIPQKGKNFNAEFTYDKQFKANYIITDPTIINSNDIKKNVATLFIGAKEVSVVDGYADASGINKFDMFPLLPIV